MAKHVFVDLSDQTSSGDEISRCMSDLKPAMKQQILMSFMTTQVVNPACSKTITELI